MYGQKRNVTFIEELPELDDLESSPGQSRFDTPYQNGPSHSVGDPLNFQDHGNSAQVPDKFRKFIRNSMGQPPPESGMNTYHQQQQQQQHQQEFFQPNIQQQQPLQPMRPSDDSPTCLTVADHIGCCPICSKFYKSDNSIYIISIVILAIICILLLKKVLNL